MNHHQPEHLRGHLAELYAERRRHREEVAELVRQLDLARQREKLLAEQSLSLTSMALLERKEVERLEHLVSGLRKRLAAATKAAPCTCQGHGDDYQPGPVS